MVHLPTSRIQAFRAVSPAISFASPFGAAWVACLALAILYAGSYLAYPALPGNDPAHPGGWWGWWDQSHFLDSARAFAHGDFAPDRHLYPLGYALLGAAFMPGTHPFFFVDGASLLIACLAFIAFARRCGLPPTPAAILFVLSAAGDSILFSQWVVPWNTTPAAAAIWVCLALAAAYLDGQRRPALLGLSCAVLATLRPTDTLIVVPPLALCLAADIRARRPAVRHAAAFLAGAAVPALAYLALHTFIYGPHRSPYMALSAHIGFTLHHAGLKAFMMLIDPAGWIGSGEGLLRRAPWLVLGIAGLAPALSRSKPALLASALMAHGLLYLAFVDLTPMGLWRYLNVHYYTWAFPGFALLAVLLIADIRTPSAGRRPLAVASLAAAAALLCVRYDPAAALPGQTIDAIDIPIRPDFQGVYLGPLSVTDARGALSDGADIRAVAMPDSIRVLSLKRSLAAPVTARVNTAEPVPAAGLHARLGLGLPFLPWASPGEFGPR